MNEVTIRVPATTANLGPGYDALGVALQIYNHVTIRRGAAAAPHPMTTEVARVFFAAAAQEPFDFDWSIVGEVPQSRGMGSSVTVRLGLLHGLNELTDRPLDDQRLFALCAQLEGHPDNAAPAAFGGFNVSGPIGVPLRCEVAPELKFVLLIPDFEVSTPAARSVLPGWIDRARAVTSCGNACRITAAFFQRDYPKLRGAFADYLHQPYRLPLIPFLPEVIAAGERAGALGGFLSGSGSTICCVALDHAEAIADAMLRASGNKGAQTLITIADNTGARLL